MIAHALRTYPLPISLASLVVGFGLMMSGYLPLGIAGAVLIVLAFFVPFLRLDGKGTPAARNEAESPTTAIPVQEEEAVESGLYSEVEQSQFKRLKTNLTLASLALDRAIEGNSREYLATVATHQMEAATHYVRWIDALCQQGRVAANVDVIGSYAQQLESLRAKAMALQTALFKESDEPAPIADGPSTAERPAQSEPRSRRSGSSV